MDWKKRRDGFVARVFSALPFLTELWGRLYPIVEPEGLPFVRLQRPLSQIKLALLTTAGIHHPQQELFDMSNPNGDASLRRLDLATLSQGYTVTHDYYDSRDVLRDVNIVLPHERCRELIDLCELGSLHPVAYSLMGHLLGPRLTQLREETAPRIALELVAQKVDAALLTPA
jgi:D-proline reductase (dithiol) PrdB